MISAKISRKSISLAASSRTNKLRVRPREKYIVEPSSEDEDSELRCEEQVQLYERIAV